MSNFLRRCFNSTAASRDLRAFLDLEALKGKTPVLGKEWTAPQLRLKSWEDLHKLWFVLLKERQMLQSEFLRYKSLGEQAPAGERYRAVKKSMCRIKGVLTERALAESDPAKKEELKRRINAL